MPAWVARGGQWVLEEGDSANAAKNNLCSVIRFDYNEPKKEADKRRLNFTTRNDNKRLKRTLVGDDILQEKLRILQSLSNDTKYWLIYNAGDSCSILSGGYNEAEWEQHTQGLVNTLVNLYSQSNGVALLEEDIHNIEHYDVEMYNTIGKLMNDLLESEASINIASRQKMNDDADECCTDDDDEATTPSPKQSPNINMEEDDDMDFTSENEPELRCNDSNNDKPPRTDSCEEKIGALFKHEPEFAIKLFHNNERVDLLEDDWLAFFRLRGEYKGRRMIVCGSNFTAFAEKTNLSTIERSIKVQNASTKVLAALGSIDTETARKILAKKKSYLAWLHFGSQEDDTDHDECGVDDELDIASSSGDENADTLDEPSSTSGRFYMSRRNHLPSDMCTGHIPSGLKCLLNIIPVQYRTLIFLCVELEGLRFRLLLKALGGKVPIGSNTRLPIDANGASICGGSLAIGRFPTTPCTCKKGGALLCMFKAQDPKDPLFGHLVCNHCSKTLYRRLETITFEVEAHGLDINRIISLQPKISFVMNAFATNVALQTLTLSHPITAVTTHVMNQVGFLQSDVEDTNLVKLLTEWVQWLLRARGVKTTETNRKTIAHAPLQAKKAKKMGEPQQRLLWKFIETCPVQHTLEWYNKAREAMGMDPWQARFPQTNPNRHPVAQYLSHTPTNPF